jgi:hypothetical protein
VKPTRSVNSTVTILRSSRAGSAASALPQKRNPSGFSWLQFAQTSTDTPYDRCGVASS